MNILEAMQALKDGKKIRKRQWENMNFYIQLNRNFQIVDPQGDVAAMNTYKLGGDEWELYDDTEYFDFFEAVARMRYGKVVANKECPSKHYYVDDGEFGYKDTQGKYYHCSGVSIGLTNSTEWFEVKD